MLDELGPWLDRGKAKDLLNRLENERPNQALPAEYELSVSWAVSKIATLEIDRPSGTRTPDIYSPDLLPSGPIIADVAALDDFSLSGADSMRRACNIINAQADRFLANSSNHLHYTFDETMGYESAQNGRSAFFRRKLVRRDFELDEQLRDKLKTWLANRPQGQPLALKNAAISVMVEWRGYVHPLSNYFCKMPSLTYSLRENPLYASLRLKSKQLRAAQDGVRRIVFLGDAGCGLLRDLSTHRSAHNHFSGGQVILKFLDDYPAINFVMVISASRERRNSGGGSERYWQSNPSHKSRFTPVWRRWEQAAETYDEAEEAEDFQAVGMKCRETLIQYVRALAKPEMVPAGQDAPKRADVVGWSNLIANAIAPGDRNSYVRGHLKAISKSAWDLSNWLTHQHGSTRHDAEIVLDATHTVLDTFGTAVMRHESGAPDQCPQCGSYVLDIGFEPELMPRPYILECENCGWRRQQEEA